jgi:transcription elongation factor GreA
MRTPQRKPGKYTGVKPDPNISLKKYKELENKLIRLKNRQPGLIEEVKRLALMGDFSENTAYQIAKGRLRGTNQRVLDIKDHLKNAIIIESDKQKNLVQLGSKVTIKNKNKEKTYLILGPSETDPVNNIISHKSPLGSVLIDKKIGDKIKITGRDIEYKILKIE